MKKTETTSTVLLKHHLKALKLPTVLAECEKVAQRCAAANADHLAFLLQLTELELLDRERRAAERRLKAARFPTLKTLEDFDFAAQPSLNKVLVAELMRCEFIDPYESANLGENGSRAVCGFKRGIRLHPKFHQDAIGSLLVSHVSENKCVARGLDQIGAFFLLLVNLVVRLPLGSAVIGGPQQRFLQLFEIRAIRGVVGGLAL